MKQPFELSKEKKEQLILSIKQYYLKERDEELGNLEAGFILDFIMKEIAPTFYNLGVEDAHHFLSEKLEDIFEIQRIEPSEKL
ncbi:DUF2164 domain-containing protein [Saliterribacillus persicus]|uniref:Uncharacterized protein (DUF2164 family) n=1 Tax=Saliterribacillus persicus TaxID=930114 RepID=A0A368XAF1_9BACI|nr:DUF2164 domain-containing protein [Saliterribacillus persicus]RCW63004.1 uncharacterized protein (DUF2164 family) [Saliterribacillus persicus]